jgi:hypothetical protein
MRSEYSTLRILPKEIVGTLFKFLASVDSPMDADPHGEDENEDIDEDEEFS